MSWLGGSFSSLTGQLSNLTKDILTEGTEEISDPATELRLAKEKIEELHSLLTSQKLESERLKRINKDLEEKAESSELQINAISREYRAVIESKEKEVNNLKRQHADLLDQQARSAVHAINNDEASTMRSPSDNVASHEFVDNTNSFASFNDYGDTGDWDFDDSIRLQRENNRLRSDLQKAAAEAKHWRSVAGQLGQKAKTHDENLTDSDSVLELQCKIKDLESSLSKKGEELQQQATSLHEHHRHKVSTLKERHAKEVKALKEKLVILEQQVSDASNGSQHSGTLPESERPNAGSREGELERKLINALSEKEKAQNARVHLEGVLEELQQEVERLQDLNERQQLQATEGDDKAAALQTQLSELSQRLEQTEEENGQLKLKVQSVNSDAKNEALASLVGTKEERDGVMVRLEELVSSIGDDDCERKIAELLNVLDKENNLLKEQKTKLEEQVILLEKASSSHTEEKQSLLETVAVLKAGLPPSHGKTASETDDTLDTRFSSSSSELSHSALHGKEEEVDAEVVRLRSELEKMKEESSNYETERSDWSLEKETLEDIVTDLQKRSHEQDQEIESLKSSERESSDHSSNEQVLKGGSGSQVHELEQEVASLCEENRELEKAIEELDTQHSEALAQLIKQRDKMASQISGQESEIDQYKEQVDSLNSTIEQMKETIDVHSQTHCQKCQEYEEKLAEWNEKLKDSDSKEKKIKELKEQLEKGGLVINDLHMDKQDLEQQLQKAHDDIEGKVAKLKESRSERADLEKEKKQLESELAEMEERLLESEVELEKWQQLNEDKQLQAADESSSASVELECSRLRSRIEDMEQEKETIKEEFEFLIEGNKDLGDQPSPAVRDSAFHHIFEEELKVRQKLQDDENVIQELKEYIEKLRGERQGLKEKIATLQSNQSETESILASLEQEKALCEEQLAVKNDILSEKECDLSEVRNELENVRQENVTLLKNVTNLEKDKHDLSNKIDSQEKYYETYIKELGAGQEAERDRSQSLKELSMEVDRLKDEVKDTEALRKTLKEKDLQVENLSKDCEMWESEIKFLKTEISRLEGMCLSKDEELKSVNERLSGLNQDLVEMRESVKINNHRHKTEIKNRDDEMEGLKSYKEDLEKQLGQLQKQLEHNNDEQILKLHEELCELKRDKKNEEENEEIISKLETQLSLSQEKIADLEKELSSVRETIHHQHSGIENINENPSENESEPSVLRQKFEEKDAMLTTLQAKLDVVLPLLTPSQLDQYKNECEIENNGNVESDLMERSVSNVLHSSYPLSDSQDIDDAEHSRFMDLEKEMEELRGKLSEKDEIVLELQRSNSSLLGLLEKKADGDNSFGTRLASHKLDAEVKSLRAEREHIMAVVSEKSRENSSLKSEIHRLMDQVSAGQAALAKVQQDTLKLEQQQREGSPQRTDEEEEMRKEALNNMARLVRDKDTEIEALTQKNETLLAVLQESSESQAASHLGPLLKEKETLTQQLSMMVSEREQLIACVTQKHSESLAFHAEVQRLTALLTDTQEAADKAKADYSALVPAFEGKTQTLLITQQELVDCKQKLTELEIRHGELIQKSNSHQSPPDSPTIDDIGAELEKYKRLESDYKSMVVERDGQIHNLSHKLKLSEDTASSKEAECTHLRKQLDNSKFQLTGLMAEIADAKSERELVQQKSNTQGEESVNLRNGLNQLTLAVKDKDMEIVSLKDQISTLNAVLQNQKGEQDQVAQLIRDHESTVAGTRQLQQERDYNAMLADQRLHDCDAMKTELSAQKDKVFKLGRELERLRSHLIEIEEGYTKEALEAEEREKELRNKLAIAEEQLMSSSSQVQFASQESHRQIESLQEQLQHIAGQRDSAYMQVATTQDQCEQYAASLSNLQLVLEHFQKEKDSAIALETEKYQDQAKSLSARLKDAQAELESTRADLAEALDGLDAATRLSEQLDRKEEALLALKEEVQLREQALKAAEEEISKLNSSTEAKVDKTLMHNMVLTWLTSPEKKRHEIVQLIGHVLDFSHDDFSKIDSVQNQDSLWIGFFKRSAPASNQPSKDQTSFSQLFVKFLEKESSPPPTPVKLPVEAMAAESQLRHKTAFNPFTAPRHVTHGNEARGSSPGGASSHLLIPQDNPHPSPLFAPVTHVSSAGESAILKDVLGSKR